MSLTTASEFKPAHIILLEKIKDRCTALTEIFQKLGPSNGGGGGSGRFPPAVEVRLAEESRLRSAREKEMAALQSLLEVLEGMVIPDDALSGVINQFGEIECPYAGSHLTKTVEVLSAR